MNNERAVAFRGPPPPIAQSVVFPPTQANSMISSILADKGNTKAGRKVSFTGVARTGEVLDPIMGLLRKERSLQVELQELLDAQGEGILSHAGAESIEGTPRGGSENGSVYGSRNGSQHGTVGQVIPVRQPKRKKAGLKAARRGILGCMLELSEVKSLQADAITSSIQQRRDALETVSSWETRISGLGKAITDGKGEEASEMEELRHERLAVQSEIREMEERLMEMRGRERVLESKLQELENIAEARLSSYREGLREAQVQVRSFLERPPVGRLGSAEVGLLEMPPKRRTLEMARGCWTSEIDELEKQRESVDEENKALDAGAKMWESSLEAIMGFEEELRTQMKSDMGDGDVLWKQVAKMGDIIHVLQSNVDTAQAKGWNLMLCALGAELEAFRAGEKILREALNTVELTATPDADHEAIDTSTPAPTQLDELEELDGLGGEKSERTESEDEGPDPELLISHEEADSK
jgi:hypothetical protein